MQERGWRVLLLSHPTFDFRIAVASFFIVQSSAASISGIPRLVAVLAAKDDEFFHTNSIRRRGPCGPENSKSGARCRAVGKIGGAEESAEPSRLAKDERRRLHWARERDTAQRPFGGMLLDLAGCVPLLARESALTRASLVESFGRGNQNLIVRHLKFSCPHRAGQSRKTRNEYLVFFTYDEPHWRTQFAQVVPGIWN